MGSEGRSRERVAQAARPGPREADLERRVQAVEARENAVEARENAVEARENAVEARENAVEARDAAHAERRGAAQEIGAAADRRDAASDVRGAAAWERENVLDRADMVDPRSDYGAHWPERRNAGLDRGHAKDDRTASHGDRVALTEAATTTASGRDPAGG